jgi:antitoxin component YwqK of YwqJK toxin-antitoxin module
MKRLLTIGILLLIISNMLAQDAYDGHLNMVDKEGRKQGTWKLYDDDGNLKFYGEYMNGQPVGTLKFYYPNGKIKALVNQSENGRVTRTNNFFENGHPMASGKYLDKQKDSTWIYFNEEDTTLAAEENYRAGIKEGVWKTFYLDGRVAEEITYSQNKKEGPWTQFFTDGTVKTKATYINDLLEGQFTVFYMNGMVEISGTYVHNEKNGSWVYMKETGAMEKKEEYSSGRLVKQEIMEEQK